MNTRVPRLYQHKDGRWMTRWGGKNRYFGRHQDRAVQLYRQSLGLWRDWKHNRQYEQAGSPLTVLDLSEQFIEARGLEGDDDTAAYYRKHLKRFVNLLAESPAVLVRPAHIHSIKQDMIREGFKPRTVNHDICAIKYLLRWGMGLEKIPAVNLEGVKALPLGPVLPKGWAVKDVRAYIKNAHADVQPWLACQYLSAARPSEIVRLVNACGELTQKGIFRLDRGKTDRRAKLHRYLVLSNVGLKWLARCEPYWGRLDSYSSAAKQLAGRTPGPLRHSARTHLLALGVPRADVDSIAGHYPSRTSLTYGEMPWQRLRAAAARLKLLFGPR